MIAIYARVSTKAQDTAMQLEDARRYIELRRWTDACIEYVDDGVSGAVRERPALDRMMNDVKAGKVTRVIVWKFDRFSRSMAHLLSALETFRELHVEFVSIQENIDTSTNMGKLMFQLTAAFAEFERATINERVAAGVARAKINGTRSGRPTGRPAKIWDREQALKLRRTGMDWNAIGSMVGVCGESVRRNLGAEKER